jgi:hypothetical protein
VAFPHCCRVVPSCGRGPAGAPAGRAVRARQLAGDRGGGDLLAADPNLLRSPISASMISAVNGPAPGSSGNACQARPTPLQRPPGRSWPWSARTARIRLRSSVRSLVSCARCRSRARSLRTAGGTIHASGSGSARSSWAKIAASALVVLQPCRGDRLALQRVHQVRVEAVVLQESRQPSPAERGLECRGRARRQGRRSRPGWFARRWARRGSTEPDYPDRSPQPRSACSAGRFRRRQTSQASFPARLTPRT